MRTSTAFCIVTTLVASALTAGCSDLTQPSEIQIIPEPPTPAQQVAPKADVAPKPGTVRQREPGSQNRGLAPLQAAPDRAGKKAPGGSCGG